MENKETLPIFFAVDDEYMPFLAVTLQSIIDNSSEEYYYLLKILYTNISEENKNKIKKYERKNINIEFVDLNYYIKEIKDKLYTRDYYSKSTYFRLFIPNLYPQYKKALYLDSDIVLLTDVANLYNIDMGTNLVAAAPDDVIQTMEVFREYAEKVVGVASYKNYFNAGVLLMNLDELRKFKFQEKFIYSLDKIKFAVAQDQDYLNRLCKGRVLLIDSNWNRMPIARASVDEKNIKLIHYNLSYKPWHFDDILYNEIFWKYAKKTEYYDKILKIKEEYTEEERFDDKERFLKLKELAQSESDCVGDDRRYRNPSEVNIEKSQERIKIQEKIEEMEKNGIFDVDPEDDPPAVVLEPDKVDYLKEKASSRIKAKVANKMAERFFNELVKENKVIIKEVNGLENLEKVTTGGVITCNHFNPFDSFTVETVYRQTKHYKEENKKLYKVIREGNYTNFPGFYGFLFRNTETLPLSSNTKTMEKFLNAVDKILQRGEFILIYPEQSMWWNYRKPKPLKVGAYKFASKNNVPVIPIFITLKETDIIGDDGFPIMEYYVHIEEPIYPVENKSIKENMKIMQEKNAEVWKAVYEDFYKVPLQYTTESEKKEA